MPSPIGHALAGVATAWAADPRAGRKLTLLCALLAASADLDLVTPRGHRTVTHSLAAAALVTIIAAAVTGWVTSRGRRQMRDRRWHITDRRRVWIVALTCGAAYATHLLLDWLGADRFFPYGIQLLWPFSAKWFISPWDLFPQTERRHLATLPVIRQNAAAIAQEVLILGPVVAWLWLVRIKALARLAAKMARRDHAAQ